MWPQSYEELLLEWADLRTEAAELPLDEALTLVHNWWNMAPIVSNTIHFTDTDNWPMPWDLLLQSAYCDVAKCIGIAYTLLLVDHGEIHNMMLLQTANDTYLQINETEYILGPEIGIINSKVDGNVLHQISCDVLKNKLK